MNTKNILIGLLTVISAGTLIGVAFTSKKGQRFKKKILAKRSKYSDKFLKQLVILLGDNSKKNKKPPDKTNHDPVKEKLLIEE